MCIVCQKLKHTVTKDVHNIITKFVARDPTLLNDLVKDIHLEDIVKDSKSLFDWIRNKMPRRKPRRLREGKMKVVEVKTPAARAYQVIPKPMKIKENGSLTVMTGSVKLADVSTSVAFTAYRHELQPGLASVYPRLGPTAVKFERYHVIYMQARYVPATSTATSGVIYMAFDTNVEHAAPQSSAAMASYKSVKSGPYYRPLNVNLDVKAAHNDNYYLLVRDGNVKAALNDYDPAVLMYATDAGSGATACGSIWLDYKIAFVYPLTMPTIRLRRYCSQYLSTPTQAYTAGVTATQAWPTETFNGLGLTRLAGVFTLPPGNYLFTAIMTFADSGSAAKFLWDILLKQNGANSTVSKGKTPGTAVGEGSEGIIQGVLSFAATGTAQIDCLFTGSTTGVTQDCTLIIQSC